MIQEKVISEEIDYAAFLIIDTLLQGIKGAKLLLILKKGWKKWKLVGGKKNPAFNENPIQTVIREVGEEIGKIIANIIRVDTSNRFFEINVTNEEEPHKFIVFAERMPDFNILERVVLEPGIERVAIFDERQLVNMLKMDQILPLHSEAIQQYLADCGVLLS